MAALLILGQPTSAATFTELEPNDNFAQAQFVEPADPFDNLITVSGTRAGGGATSASSADYYSFVASAGDVVDLFVSGTFNQQGPLSEDVILALYDASFNLIGFDDDTNGNFLPLIANFEFLAGGTYFVAVGDFGDVGNPLNGGNGILAGGGATRYGYTLNINTTTAVPEPVSTAGFLALGAMGLASRLKGRHHRQSMLTTEKRSQ
ncbi:PEP-CTERM sorting domain-containing protein [Anthocerotibacter panamensis]|uniref:PEP-CTERM sorting domain-containing protein n=1 Tax=Anthocerotibacter panamensis TaxID=2857077 RepID=UPI001C405727|nr:PEP-CTERM sorting domain-containing protein [Anthocerotibacter panamensis]